RCSTIVERRRVRRYLLLLGTDFLVPKKGSIMAEMKLKAFRISNGKGKVMFELTNRKYPRNGDFRDVRNIGLPTFNSRGIFSVCERTEGGKVLAIGCQNTAAYNSIKKRLIAKGFVV